MKRISLKINLIVSVLLSGVFFISCLHPNRPRRSVSGVVDDLLKSRADSIYTFPAEMEQCFSTAQRGITDSAAYYKLELFKGFCRFLQGDFNHAVQTNQRVLEFAVAHQGMAALEAICWNHRFILLQDRNQRDSAIACLHHAYDALYRSDDRRELENVCINLADQYRQKGSWAAAVRYYRKALWVVDSLQSEQVRFSLYAGLGQVYADLHNFKLAHHYFRLAENNPEPRLAYENYHYYNSLGNCYYFEEHYDSALNCFRQAYAIGRKFHQPSIDALVEGNLGEIFILLGRYDSAHAYLDKSYAFFSNNSTSNAEVVFYLNSLQASLALREGKLPLVHYYLSRPYDSFSIGPSYIYLHHKRFMEYYAQKGDYEEAYRYRVLVDAYDDSIRNIRSLNNIAEIDFRYRQDTLLLKRDFQIAQARAQLSQQRVLIMLAGALLVILLLLVILYYIYVRRKREREYMRQFALVTRLRMENVKNRLSPHYIFNVLNSLMPKLEQYADLSHVLQLFIQVLRDNLQTSNRVAVRLSEEMVLVKNYIALRQETHPQGPVVEWRIAEDVPLDTWVPSMCMQIPVENAMKYAFVDMETERNACKIEVSVAVEENGIRISVSDNGIGFDPGKQTGSERGTANGLKILYRTIDILNMKNEKKMKVQMHTVHLSEGVGHGTAVTLYVPFIYQFNL